ncbi:flagellar hook-basal body complex protein FliE [Microvirga tunisiensis]|uniref:Flagellar hook-basal body complex protein FliE n=2 Tax=Pannonibacter tanglangensis TaxID=2750084 RepID=A0ABW9ZFB9_9HYPH|nr:MULTISPECIES: flagellar hook-basal body complex protein FliE [unclassified Pannonibacter]NBN63550.1 flagellar hook-basal body complex protein FliE [Pannonibacter sp. XCT-34]NBN77187.1 flagellar hook-basal body complex protein FliE [Pannonibacter sp. XCT-53]
MSIPSIAANAYQNMARMTQPVAAETAVDPVAGADFGGMVRDAVNNVVDNGQKANDMALGLVQGKADVVDVVTAIAETEVALETMVTVRDRVIAAYEEIMRMPI